MEATDEGFDPYQVFEVIQGKCLLLTVKVLSGRSISKGSWGNVFYTPKPYVKLCISKAPEGSKYTEVKTDDVNPSWNKPFTFVLDEDSKNILKIYLGVKHLTADEVIGVRRFNVADLKRDTNETKTFLFSKNSEVDLEMQLTVDTEPTLRYSLALCMEEKAFLAKRKEKTPTIAVIGSGGGFRAMVGLSGVMTALHESGIMDAVTFVSGLSGSSWYISTLYSHPDFPRKGPEGMKTELKNNIDSTPFWLLNPMGVYRYLDIIITKYKMGQPVSLTDLFGHMIGETLLKGRLESRLSDQTRKLHDADVPFPIVTCVHVKKDESARRFQEWVEFSPYEIGMAKYGTFMKTNQFGSKFFVGKLVKEYDELALHYLQGVWGSAFAILFRRLFPIKNNMDTPEMRRDDLATHIEENHGDESSEDVSKRRTKSKSYWAKIWDVLTTRAWRAGIVHNLLRGLHLQKMYPLAPFSPVKEESEDETDSPSLNNVNYAENVVNVGDATSKTQVNVEERPVQFIRKLEDVEVGKIPGKAVFECELSKPVPVKWFRDNTLLSPSNKYKMIDEGKVHRLKISDVDGEDVGNYCVIAVEQKSEASIFGDAFIDINKKTSTRAKNMYVVDAGLAFNSPYPLVMRPQRGMDIIISFDFSGRKSDTRCLFDELLLAEEWAKKQGIPFPPIDTSVFDRYGVKELYIFKHPNDSKCPVVLHFPLVNKEFRIFSKPGVPRQTDEEKEFADFDIFDDPKDPYSTFKFQYSHKTFERLHQLMEFNTLMHVETIKDVIADCMVKKSKSRDVLITVENIEHLNMVSKRNRSRLSTFVRLRSSGISSPLSTSELDRELANVNEKQEEADVLETLPDLE